MFHDRYKEDVLVGETVSWLLVYDATKLADPVSNVIRGEIKVSCGNGPPASIKTEELRIQRPR